MDPGRSLEETIRRIGVIAHDFNNLFTAINGYVDLAHSQLPADSQVSAFLDEVAKAGARAAELNRELLALSRAHSEPALHEPGPG